MSAIAKTGKGYRFAQRSRKQSPCPQWRHRVLGCWVLRPSGWGFLYQRFSLLVCDETRQFRNQQSRTLVRWQPWFSLRLAAYNFFWLSENWVVILIGGGFLIWWTVEHHLSRWQFLGILLLVSLPYTVLESWAKRRVKLIYLRKQQKASA